MKKLFLFMCLLFVTSSAVADVTTDLNFKKAENTIIDILRIKDETLDARNIKFDYREPSGLDFGICCFTKKELVAIEIKKKVQLGRFLVTVGNANYQEYQKGVLKTEISVQSDSLALASFHCEHRARSIAESLLENVTDIEDQEKGRESTYYAPIYNFNVKSDKKTVGVLSLSAVNCELHSVSFEN